MCVVYDCALDRAYAFRPPTTVITTIRPHDEKATVHDRPWRCIGVLTVISATIHNDPPSNHTTRQIQLDTCRDSFKIGCWMQVGSLWTTWIIQLFQCDDCESQIFARERFWSGDLYNVECIQINVCCSSISSQTVYHSNSVYSILYIAKVQQWALSSFFCRKFGHQRWQTARNHSQIPWEHVYAFSQSTDQFLPLSVSVWCSWIPLIK